MLVGEGLVSDRSVKHSIDDQLHRTKYVTRIAEAIRTYFGEEGDVDSLTIGLRGEWGSGKTTLMNFVAENLRQEPHQEKVNSPKAIVYSKLAPHRLKERTTFPSFEVVELNSWGCNDYEQLVSQFFKQLSSHLKKYDMKPQKNEIQELISDYSAVLIGLGGLIPKVGGIISTLAQGAAKKEILETSSELKDKISNKLVKLGIQVVIMIDDSDRLLPDQLLTMLQFISVTVDFNNVVFVIAYNEDYYSYTWCSKFSQNGTSAKNDDKKMFALFLEKVIPSVFIIPEPDDQDKQNCFKTMIIPFLEKRLNLTGGSFRSVLDIFPHAFASLRQIKRFYNYLLLNNLDFNAKLDMYDMLTLRIFDCFQPKIYKAMSSGFENFMQEISKSDENASFNKLIQEVFSTSRVVPDSGLRITNKNNYPLFFSGGKKVFSQINTFLEIFKTNQEYQIREFFSDTLNTNIFEFRKSLKNYFSMKSETHKAAAKLCLKALIDHYDSFEPFPEGVFEQDATSHVKFEYAKIFIDCLEEEDSLELLKDLFKQEKMNAALYFYQYLILVPLDKEFLKDEGKKIALVHDWQKSIQPRIQPLWQQDAFWFSSFFLVLFNKHNIETLPKTTEVDKALGKSTDAINYLFGLWTSADKGKIDDGFAKMISPFFPASAIMLESGEPVYYFARPGQYSSYVSKCTISKLSQYKTIEDLHNAFSDQIEDYIKVNLDNDSEHRNLALRLAALATYARLKEDDPNSFDSILFTGISRKDIEKFGIRELKNEI